MKNWKILGLLLLLGIVGGFVSAGYATDCVDGCHTQFTAYIYDSKCWIYDPYQCKDGSEYRFINNDEGECVPVEEWEYDPKIKFYDCPTNYCTADCTNCAGNEICQWYQSSPIDAQCNYHGQLNRAKCSGES
jgi:hypothetical protein